MWYNRAIIYLLQFKTISPYGRLLVTIVKKALLILLTLTTLSATPHRILNLHFKCPDPGGVESHLITQNKLFNDHGITNIVVTSRHSTYLVNTLNQQPQPYGLPCETYNHDGFDPTAEDLVTLCKKHAITIIICNWFGNITPALKARNSSPVKIIYMHHNFDGTLGLDNLEQLNQVDGIITVSPLIAQQFKALQKNGILKVQQIAHIAPFWDEQQFLHCKPTRSRDKFLQENFGVTLDQKKPLICSIANLYWYKNHKVLLDALSILKQKNKPVELVLAGDGPERKSLEQQATQLGLSSNIHFIGKINVVEVAELLYHADLHILPSSHESFGLVHLEAAMMHKPFIAAIGTGAEGFIQPGINGLIFENNNAYDLAKKLEYLFDHPELLAIMGKKALQFTQKNYAPQMLMKQWLDFLPLT